MRIEGWVEAGRWKDGREEVCLPRKANNLLCSLQEEHVVVLSSLKARDACNGHEAF